MVLRIDARYPLVWRTPESAQFGVDRPVVVLTNITAVEERLIAALTSGISHPGLTLVGNAAGGDPGSTERFLARMRPAMRAEDPSVVPARVTSIEVVGIGATADRLAQALSGPTVQIVRARGGVPTPSAAVDLAVMVAHFVVEPHHRGLWLRRDIPHLPIVFGDERVMIGPMIEPGSGPCLYCLERTRIDGDEAWPAMASQLWGRRSTLDSGLTAFEVTALAARMVTDRVQNGPTDTARSLVFDPISGARRRKTSTPHPECGCAVLPETERADDGRSAAATSPTTTAAESSAHG